MQGKRKALENQLARSQSNAQDRDEAGSSTRSNASFGSILVSERRASVLENWAVYFPTACPPGWMQGQIPPLSTSSSASPFPLSADHLIPLVQINVLRATLTNMTILSLMDIVPSKCVSSSWRNLPLFPVPDCAAVPSSLAPTPLQLATPGHPPWIDMMPLAALRDNAIKAAGAYDADDLCRDLVGGL